VLTLDLDLKIGKECGEAQKKREAAQCLCGSYITHFYESFFFLFLPIKKKKKIKMQSLIIIYTYLFLIIPLMFFMSITILFKKQQFHLFPMFSVIILFLVIVIHTSDFIHFIKNMTRKNPFHIDKAFGIFFLVIAIALLGINGYFLYRHYNPLSATQLN